LKIGSSGHRFIGHLKTAISTPFNYQITNLLNYQISSDTSLPPRFKGFSVPVKNVPRAESWPLPAER